jgi:CheY-like chemotaxis protein
MRSRYTTVGGARHREMRRGSPRFKPVLAGVHVLVVDDNEDFRLSLVASLEMLGARVSSAEGGDAGFATYLREGADVIVSDLGMREGDGCDFITRVRRLQGEPGWVPAIAMSCAENASAAIWVGFHVFVSKPFDCSDLADIIRGILRPPEARGAPGD